MSGLYNLIHGVTPMTFLVLPMLGKHPDEYPRFRDCFVTHSVNKKGNKINYIDVFTRVGGGNRNCGYGEEKLMEHPNFHKTWDWEDDSTYGIYRFTVPERWKDDFEKIISEDHEITEISDEYLEEMCRVYPKLAEQFRTMIRPNKEDTKES